MSPLLPADETVRFYEKTDVTFWDLTDSEIQAYINSGEPFDKAGAYGIQGFGSMLVKHISGDYFTVVGLPVSKTIRELTEGRLRFALLGICPSLRAPCIRKGGY